MCEETPKNQFLEAGKIANTHGIAGDVVADSYCDTPKILASLPMLYLKKGESFLPLTIKKAVLFKGRVLFHFAGYDTLEAAISLKNRSLYANRASFHLPDGTHFVVDLIGLPVIDAASGICYGHVTNVVNYGASDLYEVTKPDGKKALIPAVPVFIKQVDPAKGIFISAIEGLL